MDSLFVLQVIVDFVRLHRQCAWPDATALPWIRIGFQLLSFDVVVLDTEVPLTEADDDDGMWLCPVRKGKSCMFRMHPDALMGAMEANPLSLMVLDPPSPATAHLTRLIAFTCIDMPPRERTPVSGMSEWANIQSTWTLFNHAGDDVGLVQGGILLSHLGHALAPHLQHALGMFVWVIETMTLVQGAVHVTDVAADVDKVGQEQVPGVGVMTEPYVEKADMAVQCIMDSNQTDEDPPRLPTRSDIRGSMSLTQALDPTDEGGSGSDDKDFFQRWRHEPPPLIFHQPSGGGVAMPSRTLSSSPSSWVHFSH
ncbi:Aste57867_22963 [Aphanomyces stellatus]|uniref:Aste57867_22963 protein n=1 Tax=Aphanomyces stellatus TaxID=120398 RepID=A0A485LLE8_9STRA|nr:hypothetical protein As57867_022892 [Aphanomyces stellatus]VFT99613.1 Aste57867_22963 [Aphanomyces stellatus]